MRSQTGQHRRKGCLRGRRRKGDAAVLSENVYALDLPDKLWALMEIGVGGYILGRTAEKIKGAD